MGDANLAQARMLTSLLYDEIAEVSDEIEAAEQLVHRLHLRGDDYRVRRVARLRSRLYEAHRLVDGLHRRFPDTRRVEACG